MNDFPSPIRDGLTLLCCSYNREQALRATMPSKLGVLGVSEIIVVLDGSTDGSFEYLAELAKQDGRVRVVAVPHGGVQRARNAGIAAARCPWVLLIDDDDFCELEYAIKLGLAVDATGADIAGAPWLNAIDSPQRPKDLISELPLVDQVSLRSHPSARTPSVQETPFLSSAFLARTAVLRAVEFDPVFAGNSWREETDFMLRARAAGYKLVKTPATFAWVSQRFSGGHSRRRVRYEYWVARNEALFLRRHRRQLRELEPRWLGWPIETLRTTVPRWGALITSQGSNGLRRISETLAKRGAN
jgi:glycosyltransferase involved in cell wall biosynthesis